MLGTQKIQMTTYQPPSNGMVKHFYLLLKSAIKVCETSKWTEILPVVLLGIQTAVKKA